VLPPLDHFQEIRPGILAILLDKSSKLAKKIENKKTERVQNMTGMIERKTRSQLGPDLTGSNVDFLVDGGQPPIYNEKKIRKKK